MARSRFDICLDEALRHEGGYVDHPSDPGGATNMGITHKTLARWRHVSPWWQLDKAEVKALSRAEAAKIYRASYWERSKAGSLPPGIDLLVFDYAVNSGPDRAIRTLQAELGVVADGQVGPLTLEALKTRIARSGSAGLINSYCDRRLGFLKGLSTFVVFGKGWSSRVAAIRASALAATGAAAPSSPDSFNWRTSMTFLSGYKTYIVSAIMLLAGLAQLLGVDLPALDGASAGHLIMEALAVIFLRKGFKGDISKA